MPWFFLAFIAIPLIEIALFIQIGGVIGLWPTLAIVVTTAILGSWLLRQQGAREMGRLRQSFERFSDPSGPMFRGAMLIFAGALLLTPGYLTDVVGLTLMIPAVRDWIFRRVASRVSVQASGFAQQKSAHPYASGPDDEDIIDGDYQTVETSNGPSGWTQTKDGA